MEKYFIPNIEDLYIGYECESLQKDGNWTYTSIQSGFGLDCVRSDINEGKIRTPYLTKEAIEGEGWEEESNKWLNLDNPKECTIGFRKGTYQLSFADHIELHCSITASVYIIKIYDYYRQNVVYLGECKDINSFRTIMKLLKIQ